MNGRRYWETAGLKYLACYHFAAIVFFNIIPSVFLARSDRLRAALGMFWKSLKIDFLDKWSRGL